MNFKHELSVTGYRRKKTWLFEKAGHLVEDKEHYWIWHCSTPKLVAAKYFVEKYHPCSDCQEMPPEKFLKELKLHYVLGKYDIHEQ